MSRALARRYLLGCSGGLAAGMFFARESGAQIAEEMTVEGAGRERDRQTEIARLLFNENPYGPPESAKQAVRESIDDSWSYGYDDVRSLRNLIAEREGLRPENVIISAGSGELLKIAGLVLGGGREVVSARPTFTMLTDYAMRNRARIEWVDLRSDMKIDLAGMESRVSDNTAIVYVCNPNNPTGLLVDPVEIRAFIDVMPSRTTVVVDEAYIELTEAPTKNSVVDQVGAGKNVLVTRTFSKIYGMAGLRIGYGLGRPDVIRRLEQRRVSIPNRLGLRAALASYRDEAFLTHSRTMIRASMNQVSAALTELGVEFLPTQTNFVLFNTRRPSVEFYKYMRARNILVAPRMENLDTWVRVSAGHEKHMKMFTDASREFFENS